MSETGEAKNVPFLGTIGAIVAAIFVALGLQPSADKKGDPQTKLPGANAPSGNRDATEPDPLSPLREFFRFEPEEIAGKPDTYRIEWYGNSVEYGKVVKEPAHLEPVGFLAKHHPENFEILIAAVPDPVDSKFALQFDWVTDAIQRAYEARGYTLNKAWLPWPHLREGEDAASRVYRNYPGTLLFQKKRSEEKNSQTPGNLSLVFLVGDSPIAGIQKAALTKALDLRRLLLDEIRSCLSGEANCAEEDCELRLLGPYYTGSAGSLERTLDEWVDQENDRRRFPSKLLHACDAALDFYGIPKNASPRSSLNKLICKLDNRFALLRPSIITGSASAIKENLYFKQADFRRTIHQTEAIRAAILSYLEFGPTPYVLPADSSENFTEDKRCRSFEKRGKVAYLWESNTGFGSSLAYSKKSNPLTFAYPLSISQVKATFDQQPKNPAGIQLPQTEFDHLQLPALRKPSFDGVPPYDPVSAPVIAAEHLRAILGAIHREDVRYVGIDGTDDRDIVFLNRLLNQYCPSVQTFTTSSSVILTMREEAYHMRGMIVGGSYNLELDTQRWENLSRKQRTFFPSEQAMGIYNAVLAHFRLRHQFPKVGDISSDSIPTMVGYLPPEKIMGGHDENYPPIWIGQIGGNGHMGAIHFYRMSNNPSFNCQTRNMVQSFGERPTTIQADVSTGFLIYVIAVGIVGYFAVGIAPRKSSLLSWAFPLWPPYEDPKLPFAANRLSRLRVYFCRWIVEISAGVLAFCTCLICFAILGGIAEGWIVSSPLQIFFLRASAAAFLVQFIVARWKVAVPTFLLGLGIATHPFVSKVTTEAPLRIVHLTDVSTSLSPLIPFLLSVVVVIVLSIYVGQFFLSKAVLERVCPNSNYKFRLHLSMSDGTDTATKSLTNLYVFFVLLLTIACCWIFADSSERYGVYEHHLLLLLGAVYALVVGMAFVGLWVWWKIRDHFQRAINFGFAPALGQMPPTLRDYFKQTINFRFWDTVNHDTPSIIARRAAIEELEHSNWHPSDILGSSRSRLLQSLRETRTENRQILDDVISTQAIEFLETQYISRNLADFYGSQSAADPKSDGGKSSECQKIDGLEVLVLTRFIANLAAPFEMLRSLAWPLMLCPILLLFAVSSYPFHPEKYLLYLAFSLILGSAAVMFYIILSMNKNEFFSRIVGTTPNRFSLDQDFVSKFSLFVLPLLLAFAGQAYGAFKLFLDPLLSLLR